METPQRALSQLTGDQCVCAVLSEVDVAADIIFKLSEFLTFLTLENDVQISLLFKPPSPQFLKTFSIFL